MQVLQLLKSVSGLTVRRDIYYMYLYLHAEARYGANRTFGFYGDGKLLPFMEIGRVGGSSDGLSEFWGPRVFYFICASPLASIQVIIGVARKRESRTETGSWPWRLLEPRDKATLPYDLPKRP